MSGMNQNDRRSDLILGRTQETRLATGLAGSGVSGRRLFAGLCCCLPSVCCCCRLVVGRR